MGLDEHWDLSGVFDDLGPRRPLFLGEGPIYHAGGKPPCRSYLEALVFRCHM